jgi:hypothetical protein
MNSKYLLLSIPVLFFAGMSAFLQAVPVVTPSPTPTPISFKRPYITPFTVPTLYAPSAAVQNPVNPTVAVSLLDPVGGESWHPGESHSIRWFIAGANFPRYLKSEIYLAHTDSRGVETREAEIGTAYSSVGENTLAWYIPYSIPESTSYRVAVDVAFPITDANGNAYEMTSHAPKMIQSISITPAQANQINGQGGYPQNVMQTNP